MQEGQEVTEQPPQSLVRGCCRVPDFGKTFQRLAKQVQGALPVVGLLSRLSASGGDVGRDEVVSLCLRTDSSRNRAPSARRGV